MTKEIKILKGRKLKPQEFKRDKKITLYLTETEKNSIIALTSGTYQAEQDLIKELLNEKYNLNLTLGSFKWLKKSGQKF